VFGPGSTAVFTVTGLLMLVALVIGLGPGAFVAASVAALLPLPLYAWLALVLDRLHPEPRAALAWTFVAGATAVVLFAFVLNSTADALLLLTAGAEVSEPVTLAFVAPVVEECGKAAALVLLHRRFRHQITGPLDGVVYATMVGLGFATVENVLYYGQSVADGSLPVVFVLRGVLSPFAHPVFTACTGIGLGMLASGRTRRGRAAPAVGLVAAVGLHALWNASTLAGPGVLLLVFFGVMVPVFVGLVVLCRREAGREQGAVRHYLRPEVEAGILTGADVAVLSDVRLRRRLLAQARRVHPHAGAAAHDLAADLLELANVRDRVARGAFSERYGSPQVLLDELMGRVAQARWTLPPPPPQAPESGLSGALGLPPPARW
jgi:RsiW-degrading membrane proteinase PrsW (M82 family)